MRITSRGEESHEDPRVPRSKERTQMRRRRGRERDVVGGKGLGEEERAHCHCHGYGEVISNSMPRGIHPQCSPQSTPQSLTLPPRDSCLDVRIVS